MPLIDVIFAYRKTACVYVAAKLGVADYLVDASKSIDALAQETGAQKEPLYRVMRCLAAAGIFEELPNRCFQINAEAERLQSDVPGSLKHFTLLCGGLLYRAAGSLYDTVKTGCIAFDKEFGAAFWDFLSEHPVEGELFNNAMESGSGGLVGAITKICDFSQATSIVDVGGGKGHLLAAILKNQETTTGCVFDLPYLEQQAQAYLAEQGLSDRCCYIAGSFFEAIPKDADVYLLKVVLHDWSDEECLKILRNCRKAIGQSGRLIIVEKLLEEKDNRLLTCLSDINMLATLSGKERSLEEFQVLLGHAGFSIQHTALIPSTVFHVIEAKPKV